MADTVELTEEAIQAYLDGAIQNWRNKRERARRHLTTRYSTKQDRLYEQARCYVDAYQSVRTSLFGDTLVVEEESSDV